MNYFSAPGLRVIPSLDIKFKIIVDMVCEHFNLSPWQLKDKTRGRFISGARQLAMFFIRRDTGISLANVGYYFGGRDHTTVIHSVSVINDMIQTNDPLKAHYLEIDKKLSAV